MNEEPYNLWREVILDALVVNHILNDEHLHNPRKALADLIAWEQALALDPAVSSDARRLRDTYRQEVDELRLLLWWGIVVDRRPSTD